MVENKKHERNNMHVVSRDPPSLLATTARISYDEFDNGNVDASNKDQNMK